MSLPDPARVATASRRFERFFGELRTAFVERDDLLMQVSLALLAKEHVLMTGPPGTAKSQVAAAVLRRILDETTGAPSLYARQFTESTVQTDLVGPIDFKTLVDTGRTEHFTDQGILGAVHAFLDEVFDGRDMLLRSALNVLHERELKEGTKTTRGAIEVAMMTSNRYLAEVLEGSRETLLAFVDRIAFVAFMPRGFADPKNLASVLRRHVGGAGKLELTAPLTVQDLDALQATVDSVHVSDAACDAIATFLEALELELNAAAKADPTFIPTRYVSTRTAVRCGRVLRAIVVSQRIFTQPERPLEVMPADFAWLRLHLMLSGPSPEMIERLLAKETDPRERRQLAIVRTEREAFDRCLAKVPQFTAAPRVQIDLGKREKATQDALASGDPARLAKAMQELVQLTHAGGPGADRAALLVRQVVDSLATRALRAGLLAAGRPHQIGRIDGIATELDNLAARLDESAAGTDGDARTLARWLRGRAIGLLDTGAAFDPAAVAADVEGALDERGGHDARISRRLIGLEDLAKLRSRILTAGADVADPVASARTWTTAITRAEEDMAVLLDAGFRTRVGQVLAETPRDKLGEVLGALAPDLARLDELSVRLTALADGRSRLKERVVGPRIGDLLAAIFRTIDATDRAALVRQVETLLRTLENAGLEEAIDPAQWVVWSTVALVRSDVGAPPPPEGAPDNESWRALRSAEQRTPIAVTLREVALRVARIHGDADVAERTIRELVAQLPDALRGDAADSDLARIERAIDHLEKWWWGLTGGAEGGEIPLDEARDALRALVASRFLHVVLDEGALLRFTLEVQVVGDTFAAHADRAEALRKRGESLSQRVRAQVSALGRAAGDRAWADVLSRALSTGRQ